MATKRIDFFCQALRRWAELLCHFCLGWSLSSDSWSRRAGDGSPHKVDWLDWADHATGIDLTSFLAESTVGNVWDCSSDAISTGSLAFQKVWLDW